MSTLLGRVEDFARRQHDVIAVSTRWATSASWAGSWRPPSRFILLCHVEVDGWEHHREHEDFNRDCYRGLVHRANGYEVVRISADHFYDEPQLVLDALVPPVACAA